MNEHKYPLGSLLLAKNGDLGYVHSHAISYSGKPTYSIYWFDAECISGDVWEIDVGNFVKIYKEKYE